MSDDGGVVGGFDMEGGEGAGGGGPITEVSHENLGERLQSSCMGICVGLLLFFGSFPLLFWCVPCRAVYFFFHCPSCTSIASC